MEGKFLSSDHVETFMDRIKDILRIIRDNPETAMSLVQQPQSNSSTDTTDQTGTHNENTELDPKVRLINSYFISGSYINIFLI